MRCATGSPRLAPEKAPAKMAISVIPLWTVERNRPGSAASSRAHFAPLLPPLAMAFRRASREETIASSLIARTPFKRINAARRRMSSQGMGVKLSLIGVGPECSLAPPAFTSFCWFKAFGSLAEPSGLCAGFSGFPDRLGAIDHALAPHADRGRHHFFAARGL